MCRGLILFHVFWDSCIGKRYNKDPIDFEPLVEAVKEIFVSHRREVDEWGDKERGSISNQSPTVSLVGRNIGKKGMLTQWCRFDLQRRLQRPLVLKV